MGHVGGRRFSVGEIHAASKTSSANGSHLNVWGFDISAAEFPQQKKRASFGVNRPLRVICSHTCIASICTFSVDIFSHLATFSHIESFSHLRVPQEVYSDKSLTSS